MTEPCTQKDAIDGIKTDIGNLQTDVRAAFSDIKKSVNLFHTSQLRMTEILVDIARGGERITAQGERIQDNKEAIISLRTDLNEAHEKIRNVESAVTSPFGRKYNTNDTPQKDTKFDKIQVTIITALSLTVIHALWGIISGLVTQVQNMLSSGAP